MRKKDAGAQATLTRGGPHAGHPELPQDEALLALGQCQEEFVGFYALLTETEATHGTLDSGRGPESLPGRAVPTGARPAAQLCCPVSEETPWTKPGACSAMLPTPNPHFNITLGSGKIQNKKKKAIKVGEASLLPLG